MTHRELQKEFLQCIWSDDLRRHLEEIDYSFTERELLGIGYRFAPTYDRRLELLQLLVDHAPGISEHAGRCIELQKRYLRLFCQSRADAVYELQIKDFQDDSEEQYLCADWETALEMIDGFRAAYECTEMETTRYTIVKRKILHPGEAFREDKLGTCVLGPGKVILNVDYETEETENGPCCHSCLDCKQPCILDIDVCFPQCIPSGGAAVYRLPDGSEHYGVVLLADENLREPTETVYLIPLDGEMLSGRDYEDQWGFHWHEHIPGPDVRAVDPDTLPPKLKENYCAFRAWLDANPRFLN